MNSKSKKTTNSQRRKVLGAKKTTKKQSGPVRDANGKFASGTGGLKQLRLSRKHTLIGILLIAITGGFLVYRSLAATALLATPGSGIGVQDCTAASGSVQRETSGSKRNASVCELSNGRTIAPIRFGDSRVKTTNVTQYLAETQKLTGGVRNMQVCYILKIASGTSASVNMGGYVEGGTPSGGHAHPLKTGDYQEYCDPNLYASNTRVFMRVTSGTVRVGSISLKRTDVAQPGTPCEGPQVTMNMCINPASIPASPAGASTAKVSPQHGSAPVPCGSVGNETCGNRAAAFRSNCSYSHMGKNDAIVYPGLAGRSHWHTFFGNTASDHNLTTPTAQGNSTCEGGSLNKTSYWAPALVDTNSYNSTTKQFNAVAPMNTPISPEYYGWAPMQVYYKAGFGGVRANNIQWFPRGMKIIAGGNPSVPPSGPVSPESYGKKVYFDCITDGSATSIYNGIEYRNEIPTNCPAGRYIQATVVFPQCGARNSDGTPTLDSPDHRSHMAYPTGNGCPSSHPIGYPEITEHFRWRVPTGGSAGLRFASDVFYDPATPGGATPRPGWTFHADWFNGWDEATTNTIIQNCFKSGGTAGSDCGMNNIGTRDSSGRWLALSFWGD